jgi:hypothetical protein
VCPSNSLGPKTRGHRVQAAVLSNGIQNPLRSAKHPVFSSVPAFPRVRSTTHHVRSYHYLRPVLWTSPPAHQSKPIAHAPCHGLVQYIFSSPARLQSRFLSVYAYCRHAADLKMLCILGDDGVCIEYTRRTPEPSRTPTASTAEDVSNPGTRSNALPVRGSGAYGCA